MIARLRRELEDFPALSGLLRKLEGQLKGLCRGREEQGFLLEQPPAAVYAAAAQIMEKLGEESEHPLPPAAAELSRLLSDFMMVFEHYRPEYHRCYVLAADCSLHLLCVHTGAFVRKRWSWRGQACFSAPPYRRTNTICICSGRMKTATTLSCPIPLTRIICWWWRTTA